MKIALTALLALLIAAPAAAQDWARVFDLVDVAGPGDEVLLLDPDEPRSSTDRYKRLAVEDLTAPASLPAAARLVYVATASQAFTAGDTNPDLRIAIAGATADDVAFGSLVLFTGPLFQPAAGAVDVLFGGEAATALRNRAGETVTWADLTENDIHIAIRLATTWNLLY